MPKETLHLTLPMTISSCIKIMLKALGGEGGAEIKDEISASRVEKAQKRQRLEIKA